MSSLTKQAEKIAEKYSESNGAFVFCSIAKAEFYDAEFAHVGKELYAFQVYNKSTKTQFQKSLVDSMKLYCYTHELEYTEK